MDNILTQEEYHITDHDVIRDRHEKFNNVCARYITNEHQIDISETYNVTPTPFITTFIGNYLKTYHEFLGFDQDTVKKYFRHHSLSTLEIEEIEEETEYVNSVEPIVEEAAQEDNENHENHESHESHESHEDVIKESQEDVQEDVNVDGYVSNETSLVPLQENDSQLANGFISESDEKASANLAEASLPLLSPIQETIIPETAIIPETPPQPKALAPTLEMNGFFDDEEVEEKNEVSQLPTFPKQENNFRTNQYVGSHVDEKDVKSVRDCISSIKKALSMSNIELNRKKAKIMVFCKNKNIQLTEEHFDVIDSRGHLVFTEDDIDSIYEMIKSFEETNNTIHQMSVFVLRMILEVVERGAVFCGVSQLKGFAKNINPDKYPKSINKFTTLIGDNCSNNFLCMSELVIELVTYTLQKGAEDSLKLA